MDTRPHVTTGGVPEEEGKRDDMKQDERAARVFEGSEEGTRKKTREEGGLQKEET